MDGEYVQVRQCGMPRAHVPDHSHPLSGAHFAELSVYLSITGILSMFNISKHVQKDGLEITPKFEFTTGITRYESELCSLVRCLLIGIVVIPSHLYVG
jgi:hypothetical protein